MNKTTKSKVMQGLLLFLLPIGAHLYTLQGITNGRPLKTEIKIILKTIFVARSVTK